MDGLARGLEKDLARAVTAGVKASTDALKADVREETFLALGFRNSLPKAWRGEVYPRSGDSVDAAGWGSWECPGQRRRSLPGGR